MIEAEIVDMLYSDYTLATLIEDRIYPNVIPQGTAMPAIAYQQISGTGEHDMNGPIRLQSGRWQITCYAKTYTEMLTIAHRVRAVMDGYKGGNIAVVQMGNEGDQPQLSSGKDAILRYSRYIEFTIWHEVQI